MEILTAVQVKDMLICVADRIIDSKEMLCEADRNIGDGDHGIGMAKGLEAARTELLAKDYSDVYSIFSTVGRVMIRVMGGASGIIFGLLFYGGAKNMPAQESINPDELAKLFERSLHEIESKGQAKLGDKTLIDGLVPAVEAMKTAAENGESFKIFFQQAAAAAETGKDASKQYIARYGKAKTLGERAIGFPDAGCVTLTVIMSAMKDWANQNL